VLGINAGRLGFLTASSNEGIDDIIEKVHNGDYDIDKRILIEASTDSEELKSYPCALNEIAIMKHDSSSMITLKATINGCDTITYQADGLIVATPTGSTGYSLSVGGPIIAPEAGVLTLTPIAPHSLTARPLIVSDSTTIEISVSSRSGNYLIAIDGRNESCDESTAVTIRKAGYSQLIIRHRCHSFIQNLQEKLMWGADIRKQ
jgi:NAD+ kinase